MSAEEGEGGESMLSVAMSTLSDCRVFSLGGGGVNISKTRGGNEFKKKSVK